MERERAGHGTSRCGGGAFGRERDLQVSIEQRQKGTDKGLQALGRGRARPERRRAAEKRVLKLPHVVVQERGRQAGSVAEAAEDSALSHTGLGGDVVDGSRIQTLFTQQPTGGAENARAVCGGVAALGRRAEPRKLGKVEGHHLYPT